MYLVPQSEIKIGNMRFFGGNTGINAVEIDTSVKKLVSTAKITLPANFKNSEGKKITELMHVGDKAEIRLGYNGKHLLQEKSRAEVRRILDNAERYRTLKADPMYKDVDFDWKTGQLKAMHIRHEVKDPTKDELFFGSEKLTTTDLEIECQNILFRQGDCAILCDESKKNEKTGTKYPALDLKRNGKMVEIASVTKESPDYCNRFTKKNKQIGAFNHLPYVEEKADTVCLHFHDPKMYSAEKVTNGYQGYLDYTFPDPKTGEIRHLSIKIKHVICTINEGDGRVEYFDFE